MCAIAGVSFSPGSTLDRHKLASSLLAAGEIRGRDASGFAWVNPSGDGLYKKNVPGSRLHVGRIPKDSTAMILHTRASTHGDPRDNDNNHPVESPTGNIRLVHNGVIYNHGDIRELLGNIGKKLPDVDSSVIPALIETYGLDATSELAGYASAAWFDRDTMDTIHLARFKTSTVFFASLWDGSLAFASTADILAKALNNAGVAWFGNYPAPFDSLSEGEYLQIMDGEILTESTVAWKSEYYYRGPSYYSTTSGGTTTAVESRGFSSSKGSEDKPTTVAVRDEKGAPVGAEVIELNPAEKRDQNIVAMVFSNAEEDDDNTSPEDYLSGDEYDNWVRTGNIHGEGAAVHSTGDVPLYYTMGHDGDYVTYPTLHALVETLKWTAGITGGEEVLVGPDEGNLRWVNHFGDIGVLSADQTEEFSWVKDDEGLQEFAALLPMYVCEGIVKLRNLVGA